MCAERAEASRFGGVGVRVREAGAGDAAEVGRLWRDYLVWADGQLERHYGFRLGVGEAAAEPPDLTEFERPAGRLLVVEAGAGLVGAAAVHRIRPDTAEIKRMYVEPAHRGRGLGRALLDGLLAAAADAGHRQVLLDSVRFMTEAHALYESAGFVECDPHPETEIPPQHRRHWRFFRLDLGLSPAGTRR